MSILDTLMNAQGGRAVKQVGKRFGLEAADAEAVMRRLVPELTDGVQRNVRQPGGLESLASALSSGKHQRYLEDPSAVEDPETVNEGNAILGHLFGSKDVSREVAGRTAAETGVDAGIVKKLLPLVAAVAMGALSKQTGSGEQLEGGGLGGLLGGLLGGEGGGGLGDLLARGRKLL